MSKFSTAALCGVLLAIPAQTFAATVPAAAARTGTCVDSPRAVLTVCVAIDARGPYYDVYRGAVPVLAHGRLGLVLDGFGNDPATKISNERRASVDTRCSPQGCSQLVSTLTNTTHSR